ncbi:MAG: alpha/beta hydrolase [Pirellulales bacterium]
MAAKNVLLAVFAVLLIGNAKTDAADPKPGEIKWIENVEFAKEGDVSIKLDAFVPAGEGPFPTCILVHGGGFTKGNKQTYITPIFAPLADAGFTFFTIDYRLAPDHRWPACTTTSTRRSVG